MENGADCIGRHFRDIHGVGLDLTKKEDLAQFLQPFHLQIIASVKSPATPAEEPNAGRGWTTQRMTCSTGFAACRRVEV